MSMWEPGVKDLMENVMIEMYCPEQEAVEFRFYEPNEFDDPIYQVMVDELWCGRLFLEGGEWCAVLRGDVAVFEAVAKKLHELNEELARSKKWF